MELLELNGDERTALVGLIKTVVMSDSQVSEDEIEEVEDVVAALGDVSYQQSMDSFESRFPDYKSFQDFLLTISRQDARDLIYGTVLQGAAADAIEGRESELLAWLADAWHVEVVTEGRSDGGPSRK
jgi:hypothetical protein